MPEVRRKSVMTARSFDSRLVIADDLLKIPRFHVSANVLHNHFRSPFAYVCLAFSLPFTLPLIVFHSVLFHYILSFIILLPVFLFPLALLL